MRVNVDRRIVLIADRVENHNKTTLASTDLEFVEDDYFIPLYRALKSICPSLVCYETPKSFLDNISSHKNDIVLSVWSGEKSRSRKSLVPSICEAYNIPYVGADSYLHIISADKFLSKVICEKFGIFGAKGILISNADDIELIKSLSFPIVIKPNLEGGSIGIFQTNVVKDYEEAEKISKNLLKYYRPLIAEEYIIGSEVCICIAGVKNSIDVFQVMKQKIGSKDYFTHEILSAEIKKEHNKPRYIEAANDLLPHQEKEKVLNLYKSLGKVEVIRIDGRISNQKFHLIELTPDCSLNISGSISQAFYNTGYSYEQMLRVLISNAISSWEDQNANR